MNDPIYVTKTFLPPIEEYQQYLEKIWSSNQLTNQGPLLKEFEAAMKSYFDVDNFQFVVNGTLAIQLALRTLGNEGGEIITTPFTYVATTSAILWEGFMPIFADIDPETLCIDPTKIEALITDKTKAILAVHVFGIPCDIDAIQKIADKHNLKVIYDSAHATGVVFKGKSLVSYGDISTCSFHSTKLLHTIEGGAVIAKDKDIDASMELMKHFGHHGDEHFALGINAKASEFNAAMGLVSLKYLDQIIEKRKNVSAWYDKYLANKFKRPVVPEETRYNYAYYPIIFDSENDLKSGIKKLNEKNVFPRRYFYPSLNTLPYLSDKQECGVSEDISKRIACLPLFTELKEEEVEFICQTLIN